MGFLDKSILDILIGQLMTTEDVFRENSLQYAESFEFKI